MMNLCLHLDSVDLLVDEDNVYYNEDIIFFYELMKILSVSHLKKLKNKDALDKDIGLEKIVLKATKTQTILEEIQRIFVPISWTLGRSRN